MSQSKVRKMARVKEKATAFLVLAIIVFGIGYVGHMDAQDEQEKKYFTIYR